MVESHTGFMKACFEQALKGRFLAPPNPLVGAILTLNNQVISKGFHAKFGEPHAERAALESLSADESLRSATLYVNLEPCAHFGKTPPCTDLILEKNIGHVVISAGDTSDKVNGRGIEILRAAGVRVTEGVLKTEGRFLNRRFFTFHEKKRPYIILKWAQTADGMIADSNFHSKWISGEESRDLVHEWRAEEGAILIGTNTAKQDNPHLTARPKNLSDDQYNQPLRIVIDRNLTLSKLNLYDQAAKTMIVNSLKDEEAGMHEFLKVDFSRDIFPQILEVLYQKNILSLIVEGGAAVLNSLISAKIFDEARVFKANKRFGSGLRAPQINLEPSSKVNIGNDILKTYINHDF